MSIRSVLCVMVDNEPNLSKGRSDYVGLSCWRTQIRVCSTFKELPSSMQSLQRMFFTSDLSFSRQILFLSQDRFYLTEVPSKERSEVSERHSRTDKKYHKNHYLNTMLKRRMFNERGNPYKKFNKKHCKYKHNIKNIQKFNKKHWLYKHNIVCIEKSV